MAINNKLLGGATGDTPSSIDPRDHFGTVLYTGNGSTQSINGGKYDACASFNGSNSIINFGAGGIQATSAVSNSFSISWWMKTTATDKNALFNTYGSGSGAFGFSLEMGYDVSTAGKLKLWTNYGSTVTTGFSTGAINDGNWKHIVIVKDVSGATMKVYVNNSEVLSASIGTSAHVGNPLVFGSYTDHAAYEYTGLFDQARVYDSALSSSEITSLYNESYANSFKVNFPTGKTATALYRLNGNANDETGAYDATATNVTWKYGVNFTPDMVWIKSRSESGHHSLFDTARGVSMYLTPNQNGAQIDRTSNSAGVTAFSSGGFTVNDPGGASENYYVNQNAVTYVGWCWKVNNGTTASDGTGDIASTVQVNDDAGISIVTYTTNGNNSARVGHGLATTPKAVLIKKKDTSGAWHFMTTAIDGSFDDFILDSDAQKSDSSLTAPNSTTFAAESGSASATMIAYCFHDVTGYQKIGTYTGNGSANGTLVETGFSPAFLMVKRSDTSANWRIYDNQRSPSNPIDKEIFPNLSSAEATFSAVNFYDDGFQLISTDASSNASGGTYLYLAIAAPPETTTPTLAKSFKVLGYTGDGTTENIIDGVGFSPDLLWIKARNANGSNSGYNVIVDKIRGARQTLYTNLADAQLDRSATDYAVRSINADGFTVGDDSTGQYSVNGAAGGTYSGTPPNYISYSWKGSGSSEVLTAGSRNVVASVNDEAGFSIVKLDKPDTNTDTYAHGLSAAPDVIILKRTGSSDDWHMYHKDLGNSVRISLNSDAGKVTGTGVWGSTSPTSSVFTLQNQLGGEHIAYCWREISGFSSFGTYTATGSAGSPTITTGFQPDWVLVKNTVKTQEWVLIDSVRGLGNSIQPNSDSPEYTGNSITVSSTGFTINVAGGGVNYQSGDVFIYMAFKMN